MSEKKHIDPAWISKRIMVRSLRVSVRTFERWEVPATGYIGRSPYYTVADLLNNRIQNLTINPPKKPKDSAEDQSSLEYEKYRLTKAQADAQELKNKIAEQEVVPVEFATFALSKMAAQISSVLDSLPLNLYRKHPELTTVQQENIKRELAKAMNAMSKVSDSLEEILNEYIRQSVD